MPMSKEFTGTAFNNKSYTQLRRELDEALAWFEQDDIDIDEAILQYKKASNLAKQLEAYLLHAENKIKKITID